MHRSRIISGRSKLVLNDCKMSLFWMTIFLIFKMFSKINVFTCSAMYFTPTTPIISQSANNSVKINYVKWFKAITKSNRNQTNQCSWRRLLVMDQCFDLWSCLWNTFEVANKHNDSDQCFSISSQCTLINQLYK